MHLLEECKMNSDECCNIFLCLLGKPIWQILRIMAFGMFENKYCQIAAWTAWLEAYMSSDETPTFVNCQLKYILIK